MKFEKFSEYASRLVDEGKREGEAEDKVESKCEITEAILCFGEAIYKNSRF